MKNLAFLLLIAFLFSACSKNIEQTDILMGEAKFHVVTKSGTHITKTEQVTSLSKDWNFENPDIPRFVGQMETIETYNGQKVTTHYISFVPVGVSSNSEQSSSKSDCPGGAMNEYGLCWEQAVHLWYYGGSLIGPYGGRYFSLRCCVHSPTEPPLFVRTTGEFYYGPPCEMYN